MNNHYFSVRPLARTYKGHKKHIAAAAAYQARTILRYKDRVFDFRDRQEDLVWDQIILPNQAPDSFHERQTLCDAMQSAANYSDGLIGRWVVASLSPSLSEEQMVEKVINFCKQELACNNICSDAAIHNPARNGHESLPHVHFIVTAHDVGRSGFGHYQKDWHNSDLHQKWQQAFEKL